MCETWSRMVEFTLMPKFELGWCSGFYFPGSPTRALRLCHTADCLRSSRWRQPARLLMTSALGYRDLTDPVFNSCHAPFKHQNLCIEADGWACLFSPSPGGDRLHAYLDGSLQPKKLKPARRSENVSSGGQGDGDEGGRGGSSSKAQSDTPVRLDRDGERSEGALPAPSLGRVLPRRLLRFKFSNQNRMQHRAGDVSWVSVAWLVHAICVSGVRRDTFRH